MKNWFKQLGVLASAGLMMLSVSCRDDKGVADSTTTTNSTDKYKYVLMTMTSYVDKNKSGFVSAYDAIPSGEIDNNSAKSLSGFGFGGIREFNGSIYKMFKTSDFSLGIEKLGVDASGKLTDTGFIKGGTNPGTGNFTIQNDSRGFYWDGDKPFEIQVFNPTTMQRTGSYDFTKAINERGENEAGIKFRAIGQKFLALKDGKLYANITYANGEGKFPKGTFDDFYPDVYLAVINADTGAYEKTIKIPNTGAIAYINENKMYDFDSNGDLYIVTQGGIIGGKSKISRIKKGESDIDATWSINMDDIMQGGKFVSIYAHNGKLITLIPNTKLTGGKDGNINSEDIWEFYIIDIASKQRTKISGVPAVVNPGASFCAVDIDGKTLLRVANKGGVVNGYFELNWKDNSAKQIFQVKAGGQVQAFAKVKVN